MRGKQDETNFVVFECRYHLFVFKIFTIGGINCKTSYMLESSCENFGNFRP